MFPKVNSLKLAFSLPFYLEKFLWIMRFLMDHVIGCDLRSTTEINKILCKITPFHNIRCPDDFVHYLAGENTQQL